MNRETYSAYVQILRDELVPALGCTEPIAIAFTAAKAKETLGKIPSRLEVGCSGNIIKNVQGVVVPNSGGGKGIATAAILGALGGSSADGLEVLSKIDPSTIEKARELHDSGYCSCSHVKGISNLYIAVKAYGDEGESAKVIVSGTHTNVIYIEKDGKVLYSQEGEAPSEDPLTEEKKLLNVREIVEFARTVELSDVEDVIERQIEYNTEISHEGLTQDWGAQVGRTISRFYGDDVKARARAAAAAGSDARMSGCPLPVVINSGSGNQGMTVSLPVIEYAKELKAPHEKLVRALVLSNLISLLQKSYIGSLSAYCGAVSAAAGAGCGIAFLHDAEEKVIEATLKNTLANVGGIVCDGAKPSCAAKIASSVDAAIMAFEMCYMSGKEFQAGEGLVKEDIEDTVRSYGKLGKDGMKATDEEILEIMLED